MSPKIGYLFAAIVAVTLATTYLYSQDTPVLEYQFDAPSDLQFVKNMDFKRFMGIWYDIASLPNAIEKNCKCPQSLDTLQSDLVIELAQSCVMFGKNITSKSKAVATVPGYGNWTNVNGPITAPYWVINLDPNYEWVVIGQPSRKGYWIMSRKPHMDQTLLRSLIDWGAAREFNLKDLEYPDQSCFNQKKLRIEENGAVQVLDE